jgi:hypothetical protein
MGVVIDDEEINVVIFKSRVSEISSMESTKVVRSEAANTVVAGLMEDMAMVDSRTSELRNLRRDRDSWEVSLSILCGSIGRNTVRLLHPGVVDVGTTQFTFPLSRTSPYSISYPKIRY